jgi:hypothetical protein
MASIIESILISCIIVKKLELCVSLCCLFGQNMVKRHISRNHTTIAFIACSVMFLSAMKERKKQLRSKETRILSKANRARLSTYSDAHLIFMASIIESILIS